MAKAIHLISISSAANSQKPDDGTVLTSAQQPPLNSLLIHSFQPALPWHYSQRCSENHV